MRTVRRHYLNVGIAVFFIVFAFADLSIPQLCNEEMGGRCLPGISQTIVNDGARDLSLSVDSGESHQQRSKDTEGSCEECFCCCSHIVPGSHFSVDLFDRAPLVTTSVNRSLPTSYLTTRFTLRGFLSLASPEHHLALSSGRSVCKFAH